MATAVYREGPLVREVMTTPVVTVDPETLLGEVARVLVGRGVSGAPVVDHLGHVLGVISEADLLPKQEDSVLRGRSLFEGPEQARTRRKRQALTARQAMTRGALSVSPDCTLRDAARIMDHRHLRRLLVMEEDSGLVGILSRRDIVRELARADRELKRDVELRIEANCGVAALRVSVEVNGGVVDLAGFVTEDGDAARDVVRAAAAVRGVVAVRDNTSPAPRHPHSDNHSGAD